MATVDDIPLLKTTYEYGIQRSMVRSVWDEAQWQYELIGKRKYNINHREIYIIETKAGEWAGFIGIPSIKWGKNSALTLFELKPGFAWR